MTAWIFLGDNDLVGWFTTIAYVVVAVLCWRIWYLTRRQSSHRADISSSNSFARFWFIVAVAITLLGLNKQPDLQILFLNGCKAIVRAMGWMGVKVKLQLAFIAALAAAIGVSLTMLFWKTRGATGRHYWLAFAGICLLGIFVIIRASLFNHLDRILGRAGSVLQLDHSLELTGIFAVGIEAGMALRELKVPRDYDSESLHR